MSGKTFYPSGERIVKKLLDILFYNIHYKLLALMFAILLWLLATNKEITEAEIRVDVQPVPTGEYRVVDYTPRKLTLLVEGYRKDLIIFKEKPKVNFLLPKTVANSGSNRCTVKIDPSRLILSVPSARVKKVSPDRMEIVIEKLVKKIVPVKLNVVGVRKNLKLTLSPNYVIVYVPEEMKNRVKYVKTEKIDISSIKGKGEVYLRILSNFKVEPDTVKLIFREEK